MTRPAENVCEHGDHPAPAGKRFCSYACEACEHDLTGADGCSGLCERLPRRVQRRRSKGWRMPEGAVYVGRPSKWGNPFPMNDPKDPAERKRVIDQFEMWLTHTRDGLLRLQQGREELRGHNLACWCGPDQACHADVWLRVVNENPRNDR